MSDFMKTNMLPTGPKTGLVRYLIRISHGNEVVCSCDQRLFFSPRRFAPRQRGVAAKLTIDQKKISSGTQGKVLTDQFQTVGVILAWFLIGARKLLFFSAQSQSCKTWSRFASSYTIYTSRPVARHVLLEEESSNHSTKCRGDRSAYPQETRRKYAGPFAGIVSTRPTLGP